MDREALMRAALRVPPLTSPRVRALVLRGQREARRTRRRAYERLGSERHSHPALHDLDRQLARWLPERDGTFVEAGANDGYEQSNTYWLERFRGWTGILVEPVPRLAALARRERPGARVVQAALVPADHPAPTVRVRYGGLMSLVAGTRGSAEADAAHAEAGSQHGWDPTYEVEVPARALSAILDEAGIARVDLLSLDVEGYEASALRGLDLARHAPRFALLELGEDPARRAEVEAVLGMRYRHEAQLSPYDHLYRRVDPA